MDSPSRIPATCSSTTTAHLVLSPSSSRRVRSRRSSTDSNSPEFEFWMLTNPSLPEPNLLSADELFVDGVLLPLQLLDLHNNHHSEPPDESLRPDPQEPTEPAGPQITPNSTTTTSTSSSSSKRWKDIFKKGDKKKTKDREKEKQRDKEKKREKKTQTKGATSSSSSSHAELNINIWPFSRSRSAGNNVSRPRMFPGPTRKVSSAPCSRSNSAGESKSRKWPSSPSRAGVHLGRSSPVWQVRRSGSYKNSNLNLSESTVNNIRSSEKTTSKEKEVTATGAEHRRRSKTALIGNGGGDESSKPKVVNLNVPMCMGYRQHSSCRSDHGNSNSSNSSAGEGGGRNNGGNLFNLRSLFTKKVY